MWGMEPSGTVGKRTKRALPKRKHNKKASVFLSVFLRSFFCVGNVPLGSSKSFSFFSLL